MKPLIFERGDSSLGERREDHFLSDQGDEFLRAARQVEQGLSVAGVPPPVASGERRQIGVQHLAGKNRLMM